MGSISKALPSHQWLQKGHQPSNSFVKIKPFIHSVASIGAVLVKLSSASFLLLGHRMISPVPLPLPPAPCPGKRLELGHSRTISTFVENL